LESWDEWRIEGTDYREVGDSFVVQIRRTAVGKGSGVPIEDHAFHVWTFRGGRVIRLEVFERESEALDAVGLPE
jgi:ketosteroid isomerase-like protein